MHVAESWHVPRKDGKDADPAAFCTHRILSADHTHIYDSMYHLKTCSIRLYAYEMHACTIRAHEVCSGKYCTYMLVMPDAQACILQRMHLTGVHLTGVRLTGRASHKRAFHR